MAKITIKVSCDAEQSCDETDAAQEARETAAARVKQATAPGDRQRVEVPEYAQTWKKYGSASLETMKEQAKGLLKHPENIVGTGDIGAPLIGTFAGALAKTADHAALNRAQKMALEGAHPKDIWDKTGWFQGTDKEWRFEIPDTNAKWLRTPKDDTKMSDVLHHPELYEAYPELANIWAEPLRKGSANYGEYQPPDPGTVYEAIRVQRGIDDPRSTALHEAQHAIQEREGFEPGGGVRRTAAEEQKQHIFWQAAMVAHRMQNRGMSVDEAIHDVFSPTNLPRGARVVPPAASLDTIRALAERHPSDDLVEMSNFYTPHGVYRRIAGEVEARSVQARKDMTPEERRAEPPWITQQRDVPLNRQTLRQKLGWPTPP